MKKRQTLTKNRYLVDPMMRNVALSLVRDFQEGLGDPDFCSNFQDQLITGNIVGIREANPTAVDGVDAYTFKCTHQLSSLLKRYRFQTDLYDDSALVEKAIASFMETQDRISRLDLDKLSASSQLILDLASNYISNYLGEYSDEEHRALCRFGRKASVGIPARKACEAARWELPISGSREQISWFDSEMSQIECVQNYWAAQRTVDLNRPIYRETSSLTLTLVPKSFKSLRSIMPNTTIGSYMSYGLGEMIRKRLRRKGYDIKTLQQRHRVLACQGSKNNLLVTADLSSASDSISVALVKRLFPADWYEILCQSRIGTVLLPDGRRIESQTFCTMGIGYTFPLQTLVFLAILKAIETALYGGRDRRLISVYGDDMIYSSRMHKWVLYYFKELGFVINLDKTYHDSGFRESCGGDYYRGVDVRPFQPRNGTATVSQHAYEAILYKYVNGLLARWSEYEIGRTLRYLVREIESTVGKCKLVPVDYPADSGICCPSLTFWDFLKGAKCAHPKSLGHGVYRFSFLRFVPDERKENRLEPYYWNALRGDRGPAFYYAGFDLQEPPSPLAEFINQRCGVKEVTSEILWRTLKPIVAVRSCITGQRLRRIAPFVTVSHTGRYLRRSGTSCFEGRR